MSLQGDRFQWKSVNHQVQLFLCFYHFRRGEIIGVIPICEDVPSLNQVWMTATHVFLSVIHCVTLFWNGDYSFQFSLFLCVLYWCLLLSGHQFARGFWTCMVGVLMWPCFCSIKSAVSFPSVCLFFLLQVNFNSSVPFWWQGEWHFSMKKNQAWKSVTWKIVRQTLLCMDLCVCVCERGMLSANTCYSVWTSVAILSALWI